MANPLEAVKEKLPGGKKVPSDVEARLKRGRKRLKELESPRRLNIEFATGSHYSVLSEDGLRLLKQGLVAESSGGTRPDHRVRRSRDLIAPIIQGKISSATQQVPGYEVNPTTTDPEDYTAARIADKIAYAGYENWHLRKAFQKLVWNALVTEEGFIAPYWDSSIGPFYQTEEGMVGEGDVRVRVWDGMQVMWESGMEFEMSRWWAIDYVQPKDIVEDDPAYLGGSLKSDATVSGPTRSRREPEKTNLVTVTEYIERPCPKYPEGRRLWFANGREIFPEDVYPLKNPKGEIIDEPCIHRLTYTVDGATERGRGLVVSLIESMRQYDAAGNKAIEWMQLMLVPQYTSPLGSIKTPITDEPGVNIEYDPLTGDGKPPEPRQVPNIPPELSQIQDRSMQEMNTISHNYEIMAGVRSAAQAQAIFEQDQMAWQDFTMNLAEVHSRVMRDCLTLVQQHYSEERLVQYRGRAGYMPIADFKGADLRGQTDVRVNSGSLEPKTRSSIEQRIMNIANMFPGHFPPEVILAALNAGNAEGLIESYEEDVSRANLVIGQIRSGTFWNQPWRPVWPGENAPALNEAGQPELNEMGQPVMETEVPGWMPRPFDGPAIQKTVFESWFKTDEWNLLNDAAKEASMAVYSALLDIESRNAQREAMIQAQTAAQLGMANAASPQTKPMPSLPSLSPSTNGSEAPGSAT